MDHYTQGEIVAELLRERRAEAARVRTWKAAQPTETPLRRRLGNFVVSVGDWVSGPAPECPARETSAANLST